MNIVYVYADSEREWNCSEWRCAVPARALQHSGQHSARLLSLQDFVANKGETREACDSADVIVVQRNLFGPVLPAMLHWQARGKIVVVDFDDAYDLMPPTNPSYRFWHEGVVTRPDGGEERLSPQPLKQFRWGLRLAHAATAPSRRLAADWGGIAPVDYLPNYIELANYQSVPRMPHAGIHIGWGGSLSHLQSFTGSGVMAGLKRVCRARPQVKIILCGSDRRIFEQLPLPPEQKVLVPWGRYADWPQRLAMFDIGLAPLHGAYDERRSWIKVLEYLVMQIPWVASEGPAYEEFGRYGALVKNLPSAWEKALLDRIDHLDDYRALAAGDAYQAGLACSIDANVDQLVNTYAAIAARVQQPDVILEGVP